MVDRLDCTVMPYAWGSRTAIAELTGRKAPSATPEAELWMGAHVMASSRIARPIGSATRPLLDVIAADPSRELGAATAARFGPRLPFLLKVLAAAEPLSLQAHPTESQARAGFADEDARSVPRDAPHRNYKDPAHKPELLCALTSFDALCGFRRIGDTLRLFDALAVPELAPLVSVLRESPDRKGLGEMFRSLMSMAPETRAPTVEATVAACARGVSDFARECAWAVRLAELYPGDAGIIGALLLNLVRLEPGEAIYLDAGNLHAYLDGVGIEIMASSDNVLRGGLTKKHVDVPELMRVLDFTDGPVPVVHARASADGDAEEVWDTKAAEFRLSRLRVGSREVARNVEGPEILLCTEGSVAIEAGDGSPSVTLERGASAFVPASAGRYVLHAAGARPATIFRATTNGEVARRAP